MVLSVTSVREILDDYIDLLQTQKADLDLKDVISRLSYVRKILIKNEKKIWLRTKKGQKMLSDVKKVADKISLSQIDIKGFNFFETELNELENLVSIIEDESRKRNMVVT
jgi:hypothetical protein